MMLDETGQAHVLEVNFSPDLTSPLHRVAAGYPHFINDLFAAMFTAAVPDSMLKL